MRKKTVPTLIQAHPDPVMEQRLEHIRLLRRLRNQCLTQVEQYQETISTTHDQDMKAIRECRIGNIIDTTMNSLLSVSATRRHEAEAAISDQHARVHELSAQITDVTSALDPADLAYL
jgi:hypothetical protein